MYVKTNNFKPSRIRTYAKSGGSDEGSGGRRLVGEEVEGDDAEDGEGEEGGGGDQEEGGVGAEGGEGGRGELAEVWIAAPGAEDEGGAEDQGGEGERNQEELEAEDLAGGEPVDEVARGLGGLVGLGLNVAEEERNHEGCGWEDEQEFEGCDGAFEDHSSDFVVQSTVWCQVEFMRKSIV